MRRRIVTIAINEVGTRGGTKYSSCELWCGAFCAWVYRQAGLVLPPLPEKAGEKLAAALAEVSIPEPGDLVRYANGHCAIVTSYDWLGINTVDGTSCGEAVRYGQQLFATTMPMKFYSIEELIRQYEMTGAVTGEVG